MQVKEIKNKEIWENFLLGCEEKTFLQSWNWGEFNKLMGNKIWRWGIYKNNKLVSVALVVKTEARRGTFLLVPHGPVLTKISNPTTYNQKLDLKTNILIALLEELKKLGKKEGAIFIRMAPIWQRNEENIKIFKNLGFRESPIHIHPEITWELNIKKSEEELLMGMRKTTRYLIRQAQKNSDLKIYKIPTFGDNHFEKEAFEAIELFNQLYLDLARRQHFIPFSLNYLKNEFLAFSKDDEISIFLGKYKNEILAGGIFVFWQGTGFYHHGASSLRYPKMPVSYLLQWEAIKEAKKRGCQKFNFWGIAPLSSESGDAKFQIGNSKFWKHPWGGLTLFKIGFGGYKKEYLKTQDFSFSKKYWLNYVVEKLRKIKRGL